MGTSLEIKKPKEFAVKLLCLPVSFYERDTLIVAKELLGKYLVRQFRAKKMIGKIVEVEAYVGESDPASHAFRGLTPRTKIMYGRAGHAYVYFNYGMYFLLNVVTEREGFPAAVLIRALEPILGFSGDDPRPASGPGKLCRSMQIDKELNGEPFTGKRLWIGELKSDDKDFEIRWSSRIGISAGQDKLWRAYIAGNRFISGKLKQ
ncbi:MAG TPA: DNA-3-methyladenine glycosylase [Acidobacteriota bacterium]